MRLLLSLILILGSMSARGALVDYRAFLLQWFTTNGFYIGLNTNYGSAYSNSVVNIINQNITASGGDLWKTNTVEGGIWWSNQSGVAKFGARGTGDFASGSTNSSGQINAKNGGATAFGYVSGTSSLISAFDQGTLAVGYATGGGTVQAGVLGGFSKSGFSLGTAETAGNILNDGWGNIVLGYASHAAAIQSVVANRGNLIFGDAEGTNSLIEANVVSGTLAFGTAYSGGTIRTTANGGLAHGQADGINALILADGSGSIASGQSTDGGTIECLGDGAQAFGFSDTAGLIEADQGMAVGATEFSGTIRTGAGTATGGNFAFGWSSGTNSLLYSVQPGALAGGTATNGFRTTAEGEDNFTWGYNVGNASTPGYSFAYGKDFTNTTPYSFNVGWFATQSLNILTNKIQEATDTGGQISPRRVVAKPVTLTTNSATAICTITLPTSLATLGAKVYATTKIKNATDWGYVTEEFTWGAGNKAGTVTTKVAAPAQTCSDGTGGATVTTTWTATVSGTTITLNNKVVTVGIAATTTTCFWRIETDSDAAIVVTPQ